MFKFTIIAVTLFITSAVNFIGAVVSWQRKKAKLGLYFAIGMTGVTFWTLMAGLDYAVVPISLKVFFAKLEYVGYHVALVFFLIFALSYAGYGELLKNKLIKTLLAVVPISNILLAVTNDWHGWLWSGFTRSEFGDNTVIFEHGPGFLWVAASGYLMLVSIIIILWLASRHGSSISRRQARMLFFASLMPLVGNLIYLFQSPRFDGVDWSSFIFSFSSLFFLWALYGIRLLDLVPIAREKLIDSLSDGMIVLDVQDRIVDVNQSAARMIGSSSERLVGGNVDEFIHFAQSLSGQPLEREIRTELEIGDVEKHYFDVLVSPLYETHEKAIGRLVIFRDITDRKQNELRLLQLTRAVEQAPASIVVTDLNGNITFVNPRFTDVTGYSYEEAIGKNPRILKSGLTPKGVYQNMWKTILSGQVWQGELLNKKKNGELYWERAVMAPVFNRRKQIVNFTAIKEDITESKNLIDELAKRSAESESLRETAAIVTSTLDTSEVVRRILQQLKRVLPYESASVWMYKENMAYLVGGDGIPDMSEEDQRYVINETEPDYPLWTGRLPYVVLDDIQTDYAMFREPPINYIHGWMAVPLKARDNLVGFISLDSHEVGYFTHDHAQLALTYANQVSIALENARLFSNLQDELHQRQELINQLDAKNSELERFTYAVAHDLKSPLFTISGFLGFLESDVAAGNVSRVKTDFQRMNDAMSIIQARVDSILEIMRSGWVTSRDEMINFNELVSEALKLVQGRITQRGIMVSVGDNLPQVRGNHQRLLEVIQNLIDNAAKFMGDQIDPFIEIGQRGEDGDHPVFFVKDNGMGIPSEQFEKIFDLFNKLNPKADGAGIGLSLVKKIIEVHGGRIWVESEMGKGTTFYFTLPKA